MKKLSLNINEYKYYFFGSEDSVDIDVLLEVSEIPKDKQYCQDFVKELKAVNNLTNWNIGLVVIKNGYVVDTESSKGSIDSTNNSLFTTYFLHSTKQIHPLPIIGLVDRNVLLAIYKSVRTILSAMTRTQYRQDIKPILKYCHDFSLKLEALKKVDLLSINTFNQPYQSDKDCWKIIAFYVSQTYLLQQTGGTFHSKKEMISWYPYLKSFLYREEFSEAELIFLKKLYKNWICEIEKNKFVTVGNYLVMNKKIIIDMKEERGVPISEIPESVKPFVEF